MKNNKSINKRKQYGPEFKSRVAVAAIKGDKTVNQLAGIYEIHPSQIAHWKRQALSLLPEVFGGRSAVGARGLGSGAGRTVSADRANEPQKSVNSGYSESKKPVKSALPRTFWCFTQMPLKG
jgi:transposase